MSIKKVFYIVSYYTKGVKKSWIYSILGYIPFHYLPPSASPGGNNSEGNTIVLLPYTENVCCVF